MATEFYTYDAALEEVKKLNESSKTWYCPLIKGLCVKTCYCYRFARVEGKGTIGVDFYVVENGCNYFDGIVK